MLFKTVYRKPEQDFWMFFPLDLVLQNIPVSICAVVRRQMKRWKLRALQPCWYQKVLTAWSEGREGHGAWMLPAWALGKPRAAAGLQPEEQLWNRGASPPFAYGICRDRSVPRNKFNAGAIQLADLTGSSGMLAWARVCPWVAGKSS